MERLVDLHVHTTASDGSMSPVELVRHASEKGLSAIAITDHDTMEGIEDAMEEGKKCGIEVIPGVEISADFKPEMHILGYFFGTTYLGIRDTLRSLRRNREERNPKIIKRLNELGFDISMEDVEAEMMGDVMGRPHIAKVLLRKGYVKSFQEAFEKYLADGKPAYFKKAKLSPLEAIREINEAGGIPVLAHPIFLSMNLPELDRFLGELVGMGIKGIEAYYVENKGDDTGNLLRLAMKHNLLVTGGSDYHGSFKEDIEIGSGRGRLHIPYETVEKLKTYAQKSTLSKG